MIANETRKRRDVSLAWMDSSFWSEIQLRPDDIVIATFPRSGTTWVQHIVGQLLYPSGGSMDIWSRSPWLESKVPNPTKLKIVERLDGRRFFKSHAPFDVVRYDPSVRYINVARDGRDVAWSQYAIFYLAARKAAGTSSEPLDRRSYFLDWVRRSGGDLPYFQHIRSWWDVRTLPNVKLFHYQNLKNDLPGQVRDIANFIGLDPDRLPLAEIVERCTFAYMKANAGRLLATQDAFIPGASKHMIHKGENGRWQDSLTSEDSAWYEGLAQRELGIDCAAWLATGAVAFPTD